MHSYRMVRADARRPQVARQAGASARSATDAAQFMPFAALTGFEEMARDQVVEDDSLAILYAHLVHLHHFLGVIFAVAVRLVYDGLFHLRAQHMGRHGFSAGKIFGEGYLRQNLHIFHFYHVGDEVGNIIALAQYEDNLQGSL